MKSMVHPFKFYNHAHGLRNLERTKTSERLGGRLEGFVEHLHYEVISNNGLKDGEGVGSACRPCAVSFALVCAILRLPRKCR
jgi:hypothetical protein